MSSENTVVLRRNDPGWRLAALNDPSGRRGIYYRTTPPHYTDTPEPFVLEVCGGREGDDYCARFEAPADGPLRAAVLGLLGCLQTGHWMLWTHGTAALPTAMANETRDGVVAYMDAEKDRVERHR